MLPLMTKRDVAKEASPVARLSGAGGAFVEFSVVGYQYPARAPLDDHDYDANWLRIQFRVSDGKGIWSTVEPAWLTWDLPSLIQWLRVVASGIRPPEAWTVLEPLLSLDCLGAGPPARVIAILALELRSPDMRAAHADDQTIGLTPSAEELFAAAGAIQLGLEACPPR
jgi:hypothetical protein